MNSTPQSKTKTRRSAVIDLIESHDVGNQETLVSLLKKEFGIETTQAVVSRDLAFLGIVKHKIGNAFIYTPPTTDVSKEILRLAIIDVTHNESMIVVKTIPGLADFTADYLDGCDDLRLLGTISGENTIFIAPASTKEINICYSAICKALHYHHKE